MDRAYVLSGYSAGSFSDLFLSCQELYDAD